MAKIIVFSNQKGGVGKTTSCVNISSYLAEKGKKVLLIDLDPQGNATSGLGIEKHTTEGQPAPYTIYNVIDGEISTAEAVTKTNFANLDIIPSTVDLAGAEYDLVQMLDREKVLKRYLGEISNSYDIITIDCPPSLGLLTVNALSCADSVIIPIQCEFYALEGLAQLMNTIKLIRQYINPNLDIEGVLLTMRDNRNNLTNMVSEEIKKYFKEKVFSTAIPRSVRLAEAPSHGLPISKYDPKSTGGIAYDMITDELLARLNKNK